ncbi:hypothetical protein Pfo_005337 [Paulownia fortunei]|nr:hypothetical protein Pfo_005337 [Paulownia fortunei]
MPSLTVEQAQKKFCKADEVKSHSLRERVSELESECKLKIEEVISATSGKEEALSGAQSKITSLKDDYSVKMVTMFLNMDDGAQLALFLVQEKKGRAVDGFHHILIGDVRKLNPDLTITISSRIHV